MERRRPGAAGRNAGNFQRIHLCHSGHLCPFSHSFRSFSQPIIVMMAIPFGIIGAVFGHLLMGFNLSFMSLMGIVGLSGVVVNDSLILVHRTNKFREAGLNAHDSVVSAGQMRFRAIILTSLTTFGGLTPILMEKSFPGEIYDSHGH